MQCNKVNKLLQFVSTGTASQWMVECCCTSTETVGLLGTGAQDGHLDFHTAPELCASVVSLRPHITVMVDWTLKTIYLSVTGLLPLLPYNYYGSTSDGPRVSARTFAERSVSDISPQLVWKGLFQTSPPPPPPPPPPPASFFFLFKRLPSLFLLPLQTSR